MNITNLELTQATTEIFAGLICLMLAVIILMNGDVRNSWKLLKWMFLSTALSFFQRQQHTYLEEIQTGLVGL